MDRIDFTPAVRRVIQERAGNRCSYPTCGIVTTSAALEPAASLRTGIAAHIYSAAPAGPRGRGGLSDDEIGDATNGIWLCGRHAKMIDDNGGLGHPSATLLSYRDLHEARIRGEHLGLYPAVGWLHQIEFAKGPIFASGAKVQFGKLNLLFGANATGKTTLWRLALGAFDPRHLGTWLAHPSEQDVRLSYLRPQPTSIRMQIGSDGSVGTEVDGRRVPFNPLPLRTIAISDLRRPHDDRDDRKWLSELLSLPELVIDKLAASVDSFPHTRVRNLRFETSEDGVQLHSDVAGTVPGLSFRALSGREQERVVIEFATAAARASGEYSPTLLVMDFPPILWDGWSEFYANHLLDPTNQFQTIMCMPSQHLDLDMVRWNGWNVIRTKGSRGAVTFSEDPRETTVA